MVWQRDIDLEMTGGQFGYVKEQFNQISNDITLYHKLVSGF